MIGGISVIGLFAFNYRTFDNRNVGISQTGDCIFRKPLAFLSAACYNINRKVVLSANFL